MGGWVTLRFKNIKGGGRLNLGGGGISSQFLVSRSVEEGTLYRDLITSYFFLIFRSVSAPVQRFMNIFLNLHIYNLNFLS